MKASALLLSAGHESGTPKDEQCNQPKIEEEIEELGKPDKIGGLGTESFKNMRHQFNIRHNRIDFPEETATESRANSEKQNRLRCCCQQVGSAAPSGG